MTKHPLPRPVRVTLPWAVLGLAGLLSLILALTGLVVEHPGRSLPPAPLPAGHPGAEEASPAHTLALGLAARQRKQHLARLGVDCWQAAGYRGQGLKIAVLDTGFRGWRKHLGKALPRDVTARSFRSDGDLEARDSQHGILCGEVIHALAPEAQLLFANWDLGHADQFLAAARWARQQGARVISCSVVTPSWSDGEGRGAVHGELARILGPGTGPHDMLCFASAGNTTHRHWGGQFEGGGDGFHRWAPGQKDNGLKPWGEDEVSVELYWQPGADYDLYVYDRTTGREAGHASTDPHRGDWSSAVVRFWPRAGHCYQVRVRLVRGPAGSFHLTTMNSSLVHTTASSCICFPADGPEVVGMGAVDGDGRRWWYSACGPNSARPKPDLVAVIPFPSLWRPRPFSGTSAAAPQGAGLAALWWSHHPDWTANQVREAMRKSATDLGRPGPDYETGYGLIHLPRE